jgi:hypothetical protein
MGLNHMVIAADFQAAGIFNGANIAIINGRDKLA